MTKATKDNLDVPGHGVAARKLAYFSLFFIAVTWLLPAPVSANHPAQGQTHYSEGSSTYGPMGTAVTVYATGVPPTRIDFRTGRTIRSEFQLIAGYDEYVFVGQVVSPCTSNRRLISDTILSPDAFGEISDTSGAIPAGYFGVVNVCFVEVTPGYVNAAVTASVPFVLTS